MALDPAKRLVLVGVAITCLATTCYAPVGIEIRGDLESGVTIRLADLTRGDGGVDVDELIVGQTSGEVLWHLNGRARVEQIMYGHPPVGLSATGAPVPLKPDGAYYVVVLGDSGWGRDAKGTCRFSIDSTGRVQAESGC